LVEYCITYPETITLPTTSGTRYIFIAYMALGQKRLETPVLHHHKHMKLFKPFTPRVD